MSKNKSKKPKKPRSLNALWAIIGKKGGAFINKKFKKTKQKLQKLLTEDND